MNELSSTTVPDPGPIRFASVRTSRFRCRAMSTQGRPEWMALWTPGWQPRPLTVAEARGFMARDGVDD